MPVKKSKKNTKTTAKAKVTHKVKVAPKGTKAATAAPKKRVTAAKTASVKTSTHAKAKVRSAAKNKSASASKVTAAKSQPKVASKRKSVAASKKMAKTARKTAQRKTASTAKGHKISPNTITLIRIILAFVWLAACEIFIEPPSILNVVVTRFASISLAPLILAAVFFVIALTDFLDGYFARKNDSISNLGIFLDPIADKILVLCGLLFLMQYGYVNIWAVVIIVAREFLVSGMRMSVAKKGVVVAASGIGKTKTALTMASVVGFFLYMGMPPLLLASTIVFWISQILLMFAIFFTIWSGLEYFAENKKYLA